MSDTNVHRVVGNLLVGTGHLFVDTVNNQIGVNTSTPSAALDVASGDLKVGSDITIGNSGTITAANFSGNGSGLSDINSDSGSWVKDDANGLVYVANSAHKVGVGTSSPGRLLEVYTGNGTVPGLRLRRGAGAAYTDLHHVGVNVPNTGDAEGLAVITSDGNATTQEVMRICGNMRVGIGRTNPTRELDVAGDINLNGSGRTIYFDTTGGSGLYWSYGTSRILDDGDLRICTDDNMHFNTGCSSTTVGTERMVIKTDGDVGIGVASPDSKLEVRGNIQASESDTNHGMLLESGGTIRRDYGSNGAGIHFTANGIRPTNYQGSYSNGGIDLGQSNYRWNNVYTETLNAVRDGVVADFTPSSSGSYTLMNFHSRVNNGSDRGFILVQDESANSPGSSSEDLRMTVGVHNDFRSSGLHSDELWLQGGGRLCYNVGAWDSELNSIIGTPGTGSDHGGVKHEWRIANSQKMHLNSSGTLNVSGEIEAAAFTTRNTGSFSSYTYDGVLMRPDGQVYISVDDNFYFRDNASTSSNRRHLFDTNSGHAYHEGTMHQNHGLDYAEYFEWFDGNPDGEDRIGYSVSLVENTNKIKKCEPGEIPLGVVSGTSSVVGGVAGIYWTGYWKNDEWGRPTYRQLKDDNGELVFNEDGTPKMKRAKNPEYDETLSDTYLPRNKRNEWACVGLLGQVYIRKGCIRSPYWRKIKNVDDVKEYWFINPVFPDTQALDELKKDLQSEKEKVATMELLVASLVKRVGDLENLVI